ncbi:hypothetical protein GW916_12535 [bacterium]|nr:hypothetical protein [bacterium]
MKSVWPLFFASLFLLSPVANGKIKARRALVSVDGAAIYSKPDFDSEVLTYLRLDEMVVASVKTFPGRGGMGLFFGIRSQSGVKGYIADTDLVDVKTKKPLSPLLRDRKDPVGLPAQEKSSPFGVENPDNLGADGFGEEEPLYFRQFIGFTVGRKNYNQQYSGSVYKADMTFFGFRSTGPGTLFDGPPLDFNLAVSLDSPEFYSEFAQNKPNGFLVFSDLLLQLPFWESKRQIVYYALGLMMSYSKYEVKINNQLSDSSEFRLGGELGLGYGFRLFGNGMVKLDYKYHFEKYQNRSYWLSYLVEYK